MNRKFIFKFIFPIAVFCLIFINTICQNKNETVDEDKGDFTSEDISSERFYEMIKTGNQDYIIVDFRTENEYKSGYIENSINIDYYSEKLKDILNALDKGKTYLIYCRSGNRSGKVLPIMKSLGFKTVYNMSGGIIDWNSKEFPLKK